MKGVETVGVPEVVSMPERQPVLAGLRRVAGNVLSLVSSDVVNRATTFAIYALVGRHLGAHEFGQLSLALTLYHLGQVFSVAGMKTLITREVARDGSRANLYLLNGSLVVMVAALLSIAALGQFVRLMGYSLDTAAVILTLSLALLPYSLSAICESIFQAWEQMRYIAYANVGVNLAKVAVAFLMLSSGLHLRELVILLVLCQMAVVVVEWRLILRRITRPRICLDLGFLLRTARSTATFLGIDGIIAVSSSAYILVLSKFAGETEVGLYSAASQLLVPMNLLFQGLALSAFPIMCRRFDSGHPGLKRISDLLLQLLLAVALPATAGLFFLAGPALLLIYGGKGFGAAEGILRITVWGLMLTALTSVLGQVLLASLRERVNLRIVAVDALVSLVLSVVLIGQFGVMGAAASALLTKIVDFAQHYWAVSRLFSRPDLAGLIWKPALAALCMAAYLAAARDQGLLWAAASAGVLYVAVLLILEVWSAGGPRRLKARLFDAPTE